MLTQKLRHPLTQKNYDFYPLTTADQIILSDHTRLEKDGKINLQGLGAAALEHSHEWNEIQNAPSFAPQEHEHTIEHISDLPDELKNVEIEEWIITFEDGSTETKKVLFVR